MEMRVRKTSHGPVIRPVLRIAVLACMLGAAMTVTSLGVQPWTMENGQYVDAAGVPSLDIDVNPNGALRSIEGIFSPDGRVFGKMGHSERRGAFVGKNIPGERHQPLFESGAAYFK